MKKILLLAFASMLLASCEKDEKEFSKNETNIIGTWVETYPELFDGVSDTIAFAKDSLINKHFYFNGWNYLVTLDTISFTKDGKRINFLYSVIDEDNIVIYDFLDRSITTQVKDIQFTKVK